MDLRRFEDRKADHLRLALHPDNDALGGSGLERIRLIHDAIPEINFKDINIKCHFWNYAAASPFFISSMTAGHQAGESINLKLARVAALRRWPMGIGSQRRELTDDSAASEWKKLRQEAPTALLFGNLGLSQLIRSSTDQAFKLIDNLQAAALIIHLNPLQESLQPEGTPDFAGGLEALTRLVKKSSVPIIVKETGCGISAGAAQKIASTGVQVIDISGFGGTHWGRIEGARAQAQDASLQAAAAQTFAQWGIPTADSLIEVASVVSTSQTEIWASGGLRTGLDAAKCLAIGAQKAGFAKGALVAALESEAALEQWMALREFELQVALFNTGSRSVADFVGSKKWQKI
jgi:isopentenyl-diphosphate Delta-isomerase